MPFFSRAKKFVKKTTKAAGKRYGVSYGRRGLKMSKSSLSRIDKDVQMIKSRLNVEKKFKQGSLTTGNIAQMNVNSPGYFTSTITPLISKGTGESDRIGGSLKLTGLHIQLQIAAQNDCYGARKFKCHIIKSTDSSVTNAVSDLFDTNPLTNVIDYHSNRNYTNNPKAHQVIRTQYMYLPQRANSVSGVHAKQSSGLFSYPDNQQKYQRGGPNLVKYEPSEAPLFDYRPLNAFLRV